MKGICELHLRDQPEPGGDNGGKEGSRWRNNSKCKDQVETRLARPGKRKARVTGRDVMTGGQRGRLKVATNFVTASHCNRICVPVPLNLSRFCDSTVADQTLFLFWARPSEVGSFHLLA